MAEMTREQKLAEIERINRTLGRGVTEIREEDRILKRDLTRMRERRDELIEETRLDAADPISTSRVRQVRFVGSKGY